MVERAADYNEFRCKRNSLKSFKSAVFNKENAY